MPAMPSAPGSWKMSYAGPARYVPSSRHSDDRCGRDQGRALSAGCSRPLDPLPLSLGPLSVWY